jgi:hypothetical protein
MGDYSALRASPLAMLGATLKGILRLFALSWEGGRPVFVQYGEGFSVSSLRQGMLLCLICIAICGCTGNTKPSAPALQRPVRPTVDSIHELFDVLHLDDIVSEIIDVERTLLDAKLQGTRAKSRLTPLQQQIRDEYIAKSLSVVDEEISIERVRQLLLVTFQQSFSQQDIDAVTVFYRTQSGQSVLAKYPQALRAYARQMLAASDASRKSVGEAPLQDPLPPAIGAFFKPWENREFAEFFDSDIGKDIIARWPAATQKYYEETETVEEEVQTRLRQLAVECQAKIKAAGTQGIK